MQLNFRDDSPNAYRDLNVALRNVEGQRGVLVLLSVLQAVVVEKVRAVTVDKGAQRETVLPAAIAKFFFFLGNAIPACHEPNLRTFR